MLLDILSDNPDVVTKALENAILKDKKSEKKKKALEGLNYYKGEHEILNYRLFYFNSDGVLKEDKYRSNIKIQHQFHTELVDQKVQYLLSNPLEVVTEDEQFQERLKEYINEEFQELLQNAVEGASNKGLEYIYAYKDENNKIAFQIADSLGVIAIYDKADNSKLKGIVRYYDTVVFDNNDNEITITKAEIWTNMQVTYYTQDKDKHRFKLDNDIKPNPRPHVILEDDKAFYDGGSFGYIPFFRLDNNKYQKTDLEPIKALIDDYDLMACSLSNNLQDFQEAIYVVKGYPGDDLDTLTKNLKTRKTIGVDAEGGIDVKTIDIPVEARKTKLELDKNSIYKFGMGFDSSQIGDGNITNIVIKSRYALLDLKCNKAETRLRKLVRQLLKVIVDDINSRYGTAYDYNTLTINIVRESIVNENDIAVNAKTEAETKAVIINYILSAGQTISNESKLKLICDVLELDYEEEKEKLEKQEPYVDINALTDDLITRNINNTSGGEANE
ncbi:phage portal protein [Clostridium sp. SYSU_GA19001]|uniref:phage portal protein n=1 Tax=Clostridium caldaquaticum TaxID=2940653 RepID=UPI002077211A|nr:phage portal protein [Clostridium caldaquaticum]MCM8710531.1 phage portal protein [Clostridium caldaquaticum]